MDSTTLHGSTPVSFASSPWNLTEKREWSMPQSLSIVAWRSCMETTSSHGTIAEFVRRAVRDAALDAAAGEEQREAEDVVVAPGALAHRRAAELAAPNDQRVVQHAALLEILDQSGRGLVVSCRASAWPARCRRDGPRRDDTAG